MRLDNNSVMSIFKTQEKKIARTKDFVDFPFLYSSFEALIDDVIGMTAVNGPQCYGHVTGQHKI